MNYMFVYLVCFDSLQKLLFLIFIDWQVKILCLFDESIISSNVLTRFVAEQTSIFEPEFAIPT